MRTYIIYGERVTCEPEELYAMLERLAKRTEIRAMVDKSPAAAKRHAGMAASYRRSLEAFKAADRVFNKRRIYR